MRGLLGNDQLQAAMTEYGIDLRLTTNRPPVLHDGGLVTFGPAGDSYYYSRTRMEIAGTIDDHGEQVPVTGLAWFDKQWGNFLVMGGGWDWFSIQLDDGTDLMLNLIRDASRRDDASPTAPTWRRTARSATCTADQFEVSALGTVDQPAHRHHLPERLARHRPRAGARSDGSRRSCRTRSSTPAARPAWSTGRAPRTSSARSNGQPIAGQGYVELVGYGHVVPPLGTFRHVASVVAARSASRSRASPARGPSARGSPGCIHQFVLRHSPSGADRPMTLMPVPS